tara:strand:+ start:346 stop:2313 length:1968 start_codon:yes stop_codon:yes gene_type:complete
MAQVIKIKRSNSTAAPVSLNAGELAYSSDSNKLFVGHPSSAAVTTIGGAVYVNMLDHTAGTLTASSAVLVDSNSKIDQLKSGNTVITGSNNTISTSSGALTISPTANLVITHGGAVDLDAQATSVLIKDNEGASLNFNEGGTSYLKLVTTNGSEKVVIGKSLEVATIAASGSLTITHNGTLALAGQANSVTIKDNVGAALDFNEGGTSYLKLVTTNSGELVVVGKDITFANDASLLSDAAVLNFGADKDTNLTHVADTGLLLNSSREIQFRDSALSIGSSADGQLDIDADTEIEITTPTLDVNATASDFSGTVNSVGNFTVATNKFTVASGTGNTVVAGTLNGVGAADFDSTLNVDGAATMNGAVTLGNASGDAITSTGTHTFTPSADFDGGFTVAGSQTIDVGSNRIQSVGTPSGTTDAATKGYVDSVKQALDIKDSAKLTTTANLGATYNNAAGTLTMDATGTVTIDSVLSALNDRILVKDQSTTSQNGLYYVSTAGAVGVAGVFTRTTDADSNSEVTGGMFCFVEAGTIAADNAYVLTSITGSATLGTSGLVFTQFSGAGQITAGDGLAKSGNTMSVNVDNQTLSIASDTLQIKGIATSANGDINYGANGAGGGYSALSIGTYDSTNSVGQLLQVGASSTVAWSNTLDGGTF